MRLAIIGNSHVGAFRKGWSSLQAEPAYRALDLSFFAIPDRAQHGVVVEGSRVLAASDWTKRHLKRLGLEPEVRLDEQDAVLLVGLSSVVGRNFSGLPQLYNQFRAESHMAPAKGMRLISDDCFTAAIAGLLRHTDFWQLLSGVRSAAAAPMAVMAAPMISDHALREPRSARFLRRLMQTGDDARLAASWRDAVLRVLAADFTFIGQPEATLSSPITTHGRLEVGHDRAHMNEEYGVAALRNALDWALSLRTA